MRLNNSEYCKLTNSSCCKTLEKPIHMCLGVEYPYFCQDAKLASSLANPVEIGLDIADLILSCLIIYISIFGKINGTFKWCILNITIFHFFYPLFGRLIYREIVIVHFVTSDKDPFSTQLFSIISGIIIDIKICRKGELAQKSVWIAANNAKPL